jgi:mannose-6-phosphate isomerase-like protein (cupin superfamily)
VSTELSDSGRVKRQAVEEVQQVGDERLTPRLGSAVMETINGCTLIPPSEAPEPVSFGATETDGAYRVLAGTIPPGQPAPPFHVHPHTDEAFYIAGGEATFLLGDRQVRVTAGGFVFIPRRMPHTAWNSGDDPMLGLIIISPGGTEHVFEAVEAG